MQPMSKPQIDLNMVVILDVSRRKTAFPQLGSALPAATIASARPLRLKCPTRRRCTGVGASLGKVQAVVKTPTVESGLAARLAGLIKSHAT